MYIVLSISKAFFRVKSFLFAQFSVGGDDGLKECAAAQFSIFHETHKIKHTNGIMDKWCYSSFFFWNSAKFILPM